MADETATKNALSVIATTSSRLKDLVIRDGQLVFIQDLERIAFDFKGQRKFYNQTTILQTDLERTALESPLNGYYFVIDTAVLWSYQNEWIQITTNPEEVVFIGDENEFPTLGQGNKIYVNITEGSENISVWNEELGVYVVVADKTHDITESDIDALF